MSSGKDNIPADNKFLDEDGKVTEVWLKYFQSLSDEVESNIIFSAVLGGELMETQV